MYRDHPVALKQVTELRAAAAPGHPRPSARGGRWRRLALRLPRRASVLSAPTS